MNEVFHTLGEIFSTLVTKGVLIFSVIISCILGSVGYPKEIVVLILILVITDTLSKQYSLVIKEYGEFTINNFRRAWKDKVLKSRQLKNGILVKILVYYPLLVFAHKSSYLGEVIQGPLISNIIYTSLVSVEVVSFLENMDDAGYSNIKTLKNKIIKLFSK